LGFHRAQPTPAEFGFVSQDQDAQKKKHESFQKRESPG
jgi:hypothetical protein